MSSIFREKLKLTKFLSQYKKNKVNLRDLIAATGLVILLELDLNHWFSAHATLKFDEWTKRKVGHLFYTTSSFVHHYKSDGEFKLELQSEDIQFGPKSVIIFVSCDIEIYGWPNKTMGHLFCTMSSFVHHFKSMGELKLELQSRSAQFGSKSTISSPLWQMTLKNNWAPLLYYIKLCASFWNHQWIQTSVTVLKRSIRVKIDDFFLCDLEIWRMTLIGWPLLCCFKCDASFQRHQRI